MKKNLKISFFVVLSIIFIVLYIIFAAKPLTKEYHYNPEWRISTLNPVISQTSQDSKQMYFHFSQTLGYFDENGNISLYKTFPSKVSISNKYFATYNADAVNTPFYNSSGELTGTIKASGFPYFVDDNIYVFLPGGASFGKCDDSGELIWKYEGVMPITAFSQNNNFTAIGLADGSIKIFNNEDGQSTLDYAPGGSDTPVILGLDISPNGEYIAAVSGHNKQRFTISHKELSQPKIIFHSFLPDNTSHRTLVKFFNQGNSVIYNYKGFIGIYDLVKNTNKTIPIKDRIIQIEESDQLIFLLGKHENKFTVYIVEKTNSLEGSFSFEAETAFIKSEDNNLYVGRDNAISKILIGRE